MAALMAGIDTEHTGESGSPRRLYVLKVLVSSLIRFGVTRMCEYLP